MYTCPRCHRPVMPTFAQGAGPVEDCGDPYCTDRPRPRTTLRGHLRNAGDVLRRTLGIGSGGGR